jgi:hypothetical protein
MRGATVETNCFLSSGVLGRGLIDPSGYGMGSCSLIVCLEPRRLEELESLICCGAGNSSPRFADGQFDVGGKEGHGSKDASHCIRQAGSSRLRLSEPAMGMISESRYPHETKTLVI